MMTSTLVRRAASLLTQVSPLFACEPQVVLPSRHASLLSSSASSSMILLSNNVYESIAVTSPLRSIQPFWTTSPTLPRWLSQSAVRMADLVVCEGPAFPESVSSGALEKWEKKIGDYVAEGDIVASIETDKTSMEVRATSSGVIEELLVQPGDQVQANQALFKLRPGAAPAADASASASTPTPAAAAATPSSPAATPAAKTPSTPTTPPAPAAKAAAAPSTTAATSSTPVGERTENRVRMSPMRIKVAKRLKDSQNVNAMLTTFNEIDMTNLIELRNKHKDYFFARHGVKLGFMSPFVKAASLSLQNQPIVNAVIDGDDVVYRSFTDISVAVATPKGLVVPVLRSCETLSFSGIEKALEAMAVKARNNQIAAEDMLGGTFTISNGGVFGSLMGTPIINPPQSAILGMHATNLLPRVVDGAIVPRSIMYVALTYDHRLIDGREAVTFLKNIKTLIEDPSLMLLQ